MASRLRKTIRAISFGSLLLLAGVVVYNCLQPDFAAMAEKQRQLPAYAALAEEAKTLPPAELQLKLAEMLKSADGDARAAALRFLDDDTFRHADDAALNPAEFTMLGDYYLASAAAAPDDDTRLTAYRNALRARLTFGLLEAADALRCPVKPPDDISALLPGDAALAPAYKAIDGLTFDRLVNDAMAFEMTHGARQAPDCGSARPLDAAEWDLRRMNLRDRVREEWHHRRQALRGDPGSAGKITP